MIHFLISFIYCINTFCVLCLLLLRYSRKNLPSFNYFFSIINYLFGKIIFLLYFQSSSSPSSSPLRGFLILRCQLCIHETKINSFKHHKEVEFEPQPLEKHDTATGIPAFLMAHMIKKRKVSRKKHLRKY